MNELYEKRYKRVRHIIDYLNSRSPNTILLGSPNCRDCLLYHKNNIFADNPLQILVAEGLFLLRKNKKEFVENQDNILDSTWVKL